MALPRAEDRLQPLSTLTTESSAERNAVRLTSSSSAAAEPYALIALDFATLYAQCRFPITVGATDFGGPWLDSGMEKLHYAGFDLPRRDWRREVSEALMTVASAYLLLPPSLERDGVSFGIWLCYYLYFTQPPLHAPSASAVGSGAKSSSNGRRFSLAGLPPVSIPVTRETLVSLRAGMRHDTAAVAALRALCHRGAFNVAAAVPQHAVALRELLAAHGKVHRPLMPIGIADVLQASPAHRADKNRVSDLLRDYKKQREKEFNRDGA